jgi:predicted helicase
MVVDFILAADTAKCQHFGRGLTDDGVHILDAGAGTFITRLFQSELTKREDLTPAEYGARCSHTDHPVACEIN